MRRGKPSSTRSGDGRAVRGPTTATPGSGIRRSAAALWEPAVDPAADVDPAELREFLEADLVGSEADPIFKARLRLDLWRLLRWRVLPGSGGLLE